MTELALPTAHLVADLKALIKDARQRAAHKVNAELSLLYWHVGQRIRTEILDQERAAYGQQILAGLSKSLSQEFGRGWSQRQLDYCIRFAEVCPDLAIAHTVCAKLSWSHLKLVIYHDDDLKRQFYIEMCQLENWSVRQLAERTQSMLYERTAISKKPEETIRLELEKLRQDKAVSPELLLKDPYVPDGRLDPTRQQPERRSGHRGGMAKQGHTEAALPYARFATARRQAGRPVSQFDAQIVAIAAYYGAKIATRNTPDFELCGLGIVNPWLPQ